METPTEDKASKREVDRIRVVVLSPEVKFPSSCPGCLGETDLTSYTSKWETTHLRDPLTKVTQKAKIRIPICRSCKRTLLKEARIEALKLFAIGTPIFWGITAVLLTIGRKLIEALGAIGVLIVLVLAGSPLYPLYVLIRPHGEAGWPVKLEGPNTFSLENETYARLFQAANGSVPGHP